MLLEVGVFGSGNFGGQVASIAVQNGFNSVAINASEQDLNLLDEGVVPFLVGDGKGTGKNINYAKEFLGDHLGFIKDKEFTSFIDKNDVIIMAGSAGGGFGSSTIPVLTGMFGEMYPSKLFIPLTVLPNSDETYTAQVQTQTFMASIVNANVPYIVYDNDQFKKLSPSESSKKLMANIVRDLKAIRGDHVYSTNLGGIDARDLLTCLSIPGRLMIDTLSPFDESMIDDDSIVKTVRIHMDSTAHAKLVDDKLILASAVMYNVTNDVDKYTSQIKTELQEVFGTHVTDYRNEANTTEDEDTVICFILSGLNLPTTRMDRIIARTTEIDKQMSERKAASTKLNTTAAKYTLNPKQFGGSKTESAGGDVSDIFQKYAGINKDK